MKKIKSEVKFSDDIFKIKIGTIDKKNPEVIYIELGSYISPIKEKESYKNNIFSIENKAKTLLSDFLKNNPLCKRDYMLVSDIADTRMTKNKKSYFEIQIFMKPTDEAKASTNFSGLVDKINDECVSKIVPCIKGYIEENDFECFKTRK